MRLFVDTDILVDFVCRREPFASDAKRLFAHGYIGDFELQTSALSFVNAMYIGQKYNHDEVRTYLQQVSTFALKTNTNPTHESPSLRALFVKSVQSVFKTPTHHCNQDTLRYPRISPCYPCNPCSKSSSR